MVKRSFILFKKILSFLDAFLLLSLCDYCEEREKCLHKSCKKDDLGMAAVGNLRALFLDLRGRIKLLLLLFRHPMQILFSFSSFRKT